MKIQSPADAGQGFEATQCWYYFPSKMNSRTSLIALSRFGAIASRPDDFSQACAWSMFSNSVTPTRLGGSPSTAVIFSVGPAPIHWPPVALFLLLRLDRANKPRAHHAARDHRRFHEHEDVERVAVAAERRGDEAEVIGKDHAFRQHGRELHTIAFGIVTVFAAAAAWRLDHDPYIAIVAEGRDF